MAAENGNNINLRRCGNIGDDEESEEDSLSIVDVLNEQARLEAEADAVLGGSDEKNCTYPKGPLKRQALYACKTCTPEGNAGICLACSYACHEGHELYELYTKRYFTCDCGNEKFGENKCALYKEKKALNCSNHYNQNFKGAYCSCHRPYPDPEDSIEDEMIQCIVCEDWLHGRHLKTSVPEEFDEMICPDCMSKYSFLWAYTLTDEDAPVDIEDEPVQSAGVKRKHTESSEGEEAKRLKLMASCKHETSQSSKHQKTDECLVKAGEKYTLDIPDHATFWQQGWRSKLCQCQQCMEMYTEKCLEFLIDETDTVHAYEEKGRNSVSPEEPESSMLTGMDRVRQIEVVRGIMDFKQELQEFLTSFAQERKVVTEADIREFFQRMKSRRREQMIFPQNNCR